VKPSRPAAPAELVTVSFEGDEVTFWPYTGMDFSGNGSDPINLIFAGEADPLRIRSALMGWMGSHCLWVSQRLPVQRHLV